MKVSIKHNFVRLSLLHLCGRFYKATYKIVNSAMKLMKCIKSAYIKNHLVEDSSKNVKS